MKATLAAWVLPLFAKRPEDYDALLADDFLEDVVGRMEHPLSSLSQETAFNLQGEATRSGKSLQQVVDERAQKLPNCSETQGVLTLSGHYEVTSEMFFPGDCKISTQGAVEVQLNAPISFEGEVRLLGTVAFTAKGPLPGPCVTMGSCMAHPRSSTNFSGCENNLLLADYFRKDGMGTKGQAGALNIQRDLHLIGGSMNFASCSTANNGGALYIGGTFYMSDEGSGSVRVQNATAAWSGGAIFARGAADISGGSLWVHGATAARGRGGAIFISADESGCLRLSGGEVAVHGAAAEVTVGGAVYIGGRANISGGSLQANRTTARIGGGAVFVKSHAVISGGSVRVQNAAAATGGAVFIYEGLRMLGGELAVLGAAANKRGGAVFVRRETRIFAGSLRLQNATATGSGGGIYSKGLSTSAAGALFLHSCTSGEGGGIWAQEARILGPTTFDACAARKIGVAMLTESSMKIDAVRVAGRADALDVPLLYSQKGHVEVANLDCVHAPGCRIEATSQKVAHLSCAPGQGQPTQASYRGCERCPPKQTRLASQAEACTPCPDMQKITCEPDELRLPPGSMVLLDSSLQNLSVWYFCPSKEVCPGGRIKAAASNASEATFLQEMCMRGYGGPGCVSCNPSFARPDGNVMRCVECANAMQQAALYVVSQMITDMALFASATATVAGAKKERPISSTWLNLLMAFSAVAGIVMSAVMQTGGFTQLQASARSGLEAVKIPVAFFQGGASSPVMSGECLLQFFGLRKELYFVHIMTSILPALLCAILAAAKGFWLAVVVTINVFLPRFVAAFGKYLVSFRVRPADMPGGELHMDFLPDFLGSQPMAVAIISATIACCFLVAVGCWTYVVMARKQPVQPHVAYLMCAYKPEYAFWEVERLVRKMLIALLTTMIPVTVSPALQMASISLVLITSLTLYIFYQPYQVSFWNVAEQWLLIVALVMMVLTSYLISNDLHWARSSASQQMLIFLICGMAGGVCMVMMFLFARAFYTERFGASEEVVTKRARSTSA